MENIANFQAYGFLPELMARFTRVVPFQRARRETLKDILRTNVIERLTREFEDEGFRLVVTEQVLDHVVGESIRRETGARGLAAILTRHLEDAAFDVFADHPGGEVRLDAGRRDQRERRLSRRHLILGLLVGGRRAVSATSAKTAAGPTVATPLNGA